MNTNRQQPPSTRRHRTAKAMAIGLLLATASVAGSSGADAATVPNMYWRTCTWSCSPYVQSNGNYNSSVISQCNTKNWRGQVISSFYKWGRC